MARRNELSKAIPKQAIPFAALDAIRAKAEEAGDHTMVNLIIFSEMGVRPNAAASLSWSDFSENLQAFLITGQIKTENGIQVRRPTKNKNDYPVSKFVCPASKKFPNQPIRHTAWGERFKKYATAAGFPNVVLYDAKSSLVTSAIEGGFNTDLIALSLGITPEVVEKNYFKKRVESQRDFFGQIRKARMELAATNKNTQK
jgi:integrase